MAYWPESWPEDHEIDPEVQERLDSMTLTQALEEVLSAAESWDQEMAEYIIPAVDNGDDDFDDTLQGYVETGLLREKAMEMVSAHLRQLGEGAR